jgi:hypothetical protein
VLEVVVCRRDRRGAGRRDDVFGESLAVAVAFLEDRAAAEREASRAARRSRMRACAAAKSAIEVDLWYALQSRAGGDVGIGWRGPETVVRHRRDGDSI